MQPLILYLVFKTSARKSILLKATKYCKLEQKHLHIFLQLLNIRRLLLTIFKSLCIWNQKLLFHPDIFSKEIIRDANRVFGNIKLNAHSLQCIVALNGIYQISISNFVLSISISCEVFFFLFIILHIFQLLLLSFLLFHGGGLFDPGKCIFLNTLNEIFKCLILLRSIRPKRILFERLIIISEF